MGSTTRSFQLIDAVIGAGGATFSEAVRDSGVPKSTAHRLLNELVDIGALRFDEEPRRYSGGLLLARLGSEVASGYDLRQIARPHLEQLHEQTGHTATLGVRNGDEGVYLDKVESADFGIRLHSEIGKAFPLHCTGIGKVLLAAAPKAEQEQVLRRKLAALTRNTITDRSALRDELATIGERGYAIDNEEITRGMICIAAPVYGPDGRTAGALSCTFPTWVRDERGIEKEISAVQFAARSASALPSDP